MMKTCAIYALMKPSVKSASARSGVYLGDLKGGAGGDSSFGARNRCVVLRLKAGHIIIK